MATEQPAQIIGTAYFTTLQGICKVVEIIASFIAALLVGINYYGWVISVFELAAAISIIMGIFLLIIYATGMVTKFSLSWNRFQFFFHITLALYYVITVGLVFHYGSTSSRLIGGGVLGLVAIIAHLLDGVDNYRKQPLC